MSQTSVEVMDQASLALAEKSLVQSSNSSLQGTLKKLGEAGAELFGLPTVNKEAEAYEQCEENRKAAVRPSQYPDTFLNEYSEFRCI